MTATDDIPDRFEDLPDGSGCTEIWEYLSEKREESTDENSATDERSERKK